MADSMEEIRRKAASAVFALGNRSAGKGHMSVHQTPKPGWIPNLNHPGFGYIHPDKLREALAYYDIAISILGASDQNSAFTIYTKGLLLEELGEYAEAEATFLLLTGGSYEDAGNKSLRRCQQRREGTYNMRAEAQAGFEGLVEKMAGKPGVSEVLSLMRQAQDTFLAHMETHRMAAVPAANDSEPNANDDEEAGAFVAQQFVDLLLDQNYAGAKALLHSELSKTTANDLKQPFEAMFADEPFPESANVLDVWRNAHNKRPDDIATFYVTIESENAEAVTVTVTREGDALKIREIDWGRP